MKTQTVIVGVAVIFGAWWLYSKRAIIAEVVTKKINPASRENVVYQATGQVGFKLADLFKSKAELAVDKMLSTAPAGEQETITRSIKSSWEMY